MNKNYSANAIAFISIFVCIEIGASLIVKTNSHINELLGVNFEKIDVCSIENKVIKVNNKPYSDYDDSVDTIKDYMDYYIFLPVVDNKEWVTKKERAERRIKNEVLKEVSMDDKELLYRLVTREAGNQDLDGMRLIVDVVLNRVNDERFPGNIKDVLSSPGQFDGAKDLSLITPYDTCKHAVDMELNCDLEGSRLDYESIYFARSPHTKNHYKHGDHYFSH